MAKNGKVTATQDPDEAPLDKFLVLKRPELKTYKDLVLDIADPEVRRKLYIDEQYYQRPATTEVGDIKRTLLAGGILPAQKQVVERRDGTLAVVDGGQSVRALTSEEVLRSARATKTLSVRKYEFDDIELEAQLFYVLNSVRAVNADIKIRAHGGPVASLLKAVNNRIEGKIWSLKTGGTAHLSATAVVRALGTLLLEADDKEHTAWGKSFSAVLDQTIGNSAAKILAGLDPVFDEKMEERIEAFVDDLLSVYAHRPVMEEVVALGLAKRMRGGKRFSSNDVKALTKKSMQKWVSGALKTKNQRRFNICSIAEHYDGVL